MYLIHILHGIPNHVPTYLSIYIASHAQLHTHKITNSTQGIARIRLQNGPQTLIPVSTFEITKVSVNLQQHCTRRGCRDDSE
jgi:hypothetical protein